jgi:hypothetical protein
VHRLQRALGGVKGLALMALIVLPVTAATAVAAADDDTPRGSVTSAFARAVVVPASQTDQQALCHGPGALVLTRHGRLREVSVARGLRTYEHKAAGTFIMLCTGSDAGRTGAQGS